jgi:hypothetical protein
LEELTPQERFNLLLSFLKDPQAHPHPTITIEDSVWLPGRQSSSIMVDGIRQEAIEIMTSGMFDHGCLKGNLKIANIQIDRLEAFILSIAAACRIAKNPNYLDDWDNRPLFFEEFKKDSNDLYIAFANYAEKMQRNKLNTLNELARVRGEIVSATMKAQRRALARNIFEFGLVKEMISIFTKYMPKSPKNLIAFHIYKFLDAKREYLNVEYVPTQEALRKEITRKAK